MAIIARKQTDNNTDIYNNKSIYIYRRGDPQSLTVETQGHLVKVKTQGNAPQGGGKRGRVNGFSRGSRKRMQETLARIEPKAPHGQRNVALFLTLTYAGEEAELPTPATCKKHLDTLFKAIRRRFPQSSGIWRFEWDSSGQRQYNPHFHVMLFGIRRWPYKAVRAVWNAIAGNPLDAPSERVTGLRSWRGAMSYLSKYMTKPIQAPDAPDAPDKADNSDVADGATAPGCPGVCATCAGTQGEDAGAVPSGAWLVNGTYFTGRVWGVYNRECIPWGDLMIVKADYGGWYHDYKRVARRKWVGVNKYRGQGFTLFTDSPLEWVRLMLLLT